MIRKIKWKGYQSLGNLELDFTKADGTPYNTVILAGDNGTGKTTILESLMNFLNIGSFAPFDYIKCIVKDTPYTLEQTENPDRGFHKRTNEISGESKDINTNRQYNVSTLESDTEDIRYYGFAYSKARSGFSTKPVRSSTTEQTDKSKFEADESDDYTKIKQLLIDIKMQDNEALASQIKEKRSITAEKYDEYEKGTKIYRFERAFDDFFDDTKFKDVKSDGADEIRIMFEKHNREITIDQLSTGEKQIVFRGAHLLKNSRSIEDGIVLIDEPELSMHPKWQKRILKYYQDLFKKIINSPYK